VILQWDDTSGIEREYRYRYESEQQSTWRRTTPTGCQACSVVQAVATFRRTVVHRQRRVLSSAPAGRAYFSTGSRCYDVTDGLRRGNPFCRRSAADSRTVVLACYFRLLLLPLCFSLIIITLDIAIFCTKPLL